MLRAGLLGVLNPLLYYLVLFEAYDLLPAQEAQALNYTWAITLSLLSVPFLGQKLSLQELGAIMLAYLGVLFIATHGNLLALEFSNTTGRAIGPGQHPDMEFLLAGQYPQRNGPHTRLIPQFRICAAAGGAGSLVQRQPGVAVAQRACGGGLRGDV